MNSCMILHWSKMAGNRYTKGIYKFGCTVCSTKPWQKLSASIFTKAPTSTSKAQLVQRRKSFFGPTGKRSKSVDHSPAA